MVFGRLLFFVIIIIFVSCVQEENESFTSNINSSNFAVSQDMEVWIDGVRNNVKFMRLRKANGASRMRFLVELSNSAQFSLFVTPFDIGYNPIYSSIVENDEIKFSRTHLEFNKQINPNQHIYYDVDTLSKINHVSISHIDTINQTVTGIFQCQMRSILPAKDSIYHNFQINGKFFTTYRN